MLLLAVWGALADTPANCTYQDVSGTWTLYLGPASNAVTNLDQYCSKFTRADVVRTLTVELKFPDVAVDEFGREGFWTLVYNQGFEVVIGDHKYFAFSNYTTVAGKTTSFCHSTLNGLGHDLWGHNWNCYFGVKTQGALSINTNTKPHQSPLGQKYIPNITFKEEINSKQSLWKATDYPQLLNMTLGERLQRAGGVSGLKPPPVAPVSPNTLSYVQDLPTSFDWTSVDGTNYVSAIRNQGQCGSCYAFASMAMLEARLRIRTSNKLQRVFSPQEVVSCSPYAQGCAGGFPYLIAGKHAEDFGVVEESCYPYIGSDSKCAQNTDTCLRYHSTDYYYVGGFYGACNEAEMRLELYNNGPIAVGFEVYNDFEQYKSGIYHHTGLTDKFNPWEITNHAVLVVGYGEEGGTKFWRVKNSWGENWGEQGFFRIMRGNDETSIESLAVAARPIIP